jgi:D-glutamate cyclase
MSAAALTAIRDLIQEDVGNRGLRADPHANLITACPDDFAAACRSLAEGPEPSLAVVTGFFIPTGQPPCGETDGPLGALFLARALAPLGFRVALVTDDFCRLALEAGLSACGLEHAVARLTLPGPERPCEPFLESLWLPLVRQYPLTHLVALERVGPSHTEESIKGQPAESVRAFLAEVPPEHCDRCHTMRGLDITGRMSPAHLLFETVKRDVPAVTTIGIGDGGNEIGMGKIPWEVIRRNIPGGGLVACRVPTDHLIVCGVSNWGAYGLAAGVRRLRGQGPDPELFDPQRERALLEVMVQQGPLVDGVTGRQAATVDGLAFDRHAEILTRLAAIR